MVIAILGILAAIAVPRLAGFTSSASLKADEATMSTVKNAVAAAIANGDIIGSGSVTTTEGADTNTTATYASAGVTFSTGNDIDTIMAKLLGSNSVQVKEGTKTHVVVTIVSGDVTNVVTN